VCLLEIAPAPPESRGDGSGHVVLRNRRGKPSARAHMHEIDGRRGVRIVMKVRAVDPPEPIKPVTIASPHKRSVVGVGEAGDAAVEPVIRAGAAESDEAKMQRAVDRSLGVDAVVTRSHRCAVNVGHRRYSSPDMSTFKRYLAFQGMTLVFGIVGPIFLVMYFATQPDPTVRWAYWAGLFITAADVLIALWLTGSRSPDRKSSASSY
jgi:hypothetical protein